MRILFTSCPAYGHVNPMVPLAHEARLAGHDVAFATGASWHTRSSAGISRRGWSVLAVRGRHVRPCGLPELGRVSA
jgi:hypothetical protein